MSIMKSAWKLMWRSAAWFGCWGCTTFGFAQSNQTIYTDALQNGWQNWSWATVDLANASPHNSGSSSISVSSTSWQALYLHHDAQSGSGFSNLTFWINGGSSGGQVVQVQATRGPVSQPGVVLAPLPINNWRQESISMTALGVASVSDFDGFWIQVQNSGLAPTLYVDDITLVGGSNPPPTTVAAGPVNITINAALNRHSINPWIYGVAYATSNELKQLNAPLNRQGGNPASRYNWQANADNRAADYFFASLAYGSATPGEHGDTFIRESRAGGAEPSLTIPMLDWVAKLGPGRARTWSYSTNKYGAQQANDTANGWPDMGNGKRPNGTAILTNDPNDANIPAGPVFQQGWLNHFTNLWGRATNGGVRYYHLDNEPALWNSTHQDVHPTPAGMDELRDKMTNYASHIKLTDPGALVLGPDEWGISGDIFSAADSAYEAANQYPGTYPDRAAHGGLDVYAYLLREMGRASTNAGQRLLDVCTAHLYPQNGEFSDDVSTAMQLVRNRSTRSLWDPSYVEENWQALNPLTSIVKLIPRLRAWVANYYPGTLTGITEYNWGAEGHINGATAQADILGIFGRENLDLAERWTTPASDSPTFKAMQMYRNYDGLKSTFGNTSISAAAPNPDNTAAFAALRDSDGALTIMAINKMIGSNAPVTLSLSNFPSAGMASIWQLTSANVIVHLPDQTFAGTVLSNTLPAQSVTLFVIPAATAPRLRLADSSGASLDLWLDGHAGQKYALLTSSNFLNWQAIQTNSLITNSLPLAVSRTNAARFFRVQWIP